MEDHIVRPEGGLSFRLAALTEAMLYLSVGALFRTSSEFIYFQF